MLRFVAVSMLTMAMGLAFAGPDTEAHGPSQQIADAMRVSADADAAFLPAGMLKSKFDSANLATLLQFPTDEIAVVSLRGSQIRSALERSVSLYPSPNSSFLQISGMAVSFSRGAASEKRITNVNVGSSPLEDGRSYTVAMPMTLARGGLGYFRIWDKNQITKTLTGVTLESLVKGKAATDSAPRWTANP